MTACRASLIGSGKVPCSEIEYCFPTVFDDFTGNTNHCFTCRHRIHHDGISANARIIADENGPEDNGCRTDDPLCPDSGVTFVFFQAGTA